MPPPPTTTASSSSLRALLDAESADVVRELLDDGCKAWCDDLRAGPSARQTRLAKNAAKGAKALRLETHGEAEACAEACEAFVRRAVWTMGEDARPGTTTTTMTSALGFEPGSGHARLDALLVERALERRHKWREKSAAAAAMPGRFLADFDWAVRASTSTSTRRTTTRNDDDDDDDVDDDDEDEDDHPDAVCRAAARLVVRDAGAESSSVVDVHFDVLPRALRRVAASCAAARRAAETLAPDAAAEESDAPSTTATA